MRSITVLAALFAAVASSTPGLAGTGPNGLAGNGMPANGLPANGLAGHGLADGGAAAFPPGAEAREAAVMSRLSPQARAWLIVEGRREARGDPSTGAAEQSVETQFGSGGAPGVDVQALAFVVLMEATRSADDDLRSVMGEVKATNNAKAAQRGQMQRFNQAASTNALAPPCRGGDCAGSSQGQAAAKLDSMSEMGEMQSMRLQMAMDRRSKFMATLSNMLMKMSETDSAIVRSIK